MPPPRADVKSVSPWLWVPTLYFAQGLPNGLLEDVAPVFFKDLGVDNERLAQVLSLAALPWMLKAFWSPLIDAFGTKRRWIWAGQLGCAAAFAAFALTPFAGTPVAFALLWLGLVAFCSATHDIAADGFYLFAIPSGEQSFFSGIRNTTFRLAKVFSASVILVLAGLLLGGGSGPDAPWLARRLQGILGDFRLAVAPAWAWALSLFALTTLVLAVWHLFVLPRPPDDRATKVADATLFTEFIEGWRTFFRKPGVWKLMLFILLFRLPETLLTALALPFLKDPVSKGGLGLSTAEVGFLSAPAVVALLVGGVVGGVMVSRFGLRRMLWPLVIVMHLPNLAFLALARYQPTDIGSIASALLLEKFGYGFGMCAIMLYLIYVSTGARRVTHYALCSGLMVLGSKGPAFFAGTFQKNYGYTAFFALVVLSAIPGILVTWLVRDIPPEFGRKTV